MTKRPIRSKQFHIRLTVEEDNRMRQLMKWLKWETMSEMVRDMVDFAHEHENNKRNPKDEPK